MHDLKEQQAIENYYNSKYKEEFLGEVFSSAAKYADEHSTCHKVHVGACFITNDGKEYYSCNNGGTQNCNELGYCYKAEVTGIYESCEETRPYCQSVHAEINMLKLLEEEGIYPGDGVLYVTRYCCRNCLIECIASGVKEIHFCGVSEGTTPEENKRDAEANNVGYYWHPEYDFEFNKE